MVIFCYDCILFDEDFVCTVGIEVDGLDGKVAFGRNAFDGESLVAAEFETEGAGLVGFIILSVNAIDGAVCVVVLVGEVSACRQGCAFVEVAIVGYVGIVGGGGIIGGVLGWSGRATAG